MTTRNRGCFHCNDEYLEMEKARLERQDQIRKHQRALARKDPNIKNQDEIIEALKADIDDTEVLNPAIPVPEVEEEVHDKHEAKFTPADIEKDEPVVEPVEEPVIEVVEEPVVEQAEVPKTKTTTAKKATTAPKESKDS